MCLRRLRRSLFWLTIVVVLSGCRDGITGPPGLPGPGGPSSLMEIEISGIGTGQMNASANPLPPAGGVGFSLSAPGGSGGEGNGTIELAPLSTGSFTVGERGDGGVRYIYATFRVRNAQSNGTPYDTPRNNLTFLAVSTGSTLSGTAVSRLRRFDGSAADDAIAPSVLPTGAVVQDRDGHVAPRFADVLQAFTEAEAAGFATPAGVDVLPYGFVVSNPNSSTSRTLPASPAPGQYDGVVTFAFRIPLQASPAADPFTISVMMQAVDDNVTRLTQSIEEQGEGQAAFEQRAASLGAASVTLLAGGSYSGGLPTRTLCLVRTAGPAGAPTATIGSGPPCVPSGMMVAWTGAASSDWSDRANWSPEVVPGVNDTVSIQSAALQPVISDGDRVIRSLVMADTLGSTLDLGGYTLTIGGDFTAPSGAVINGTVTMSGNDARLSGTVPMLKIEGDVRLQGSTTGAGPVTVSGTLSTHGQPLTLSLP